MLSDSGAQATRADTSEANVRATNQTAAADVSPAAKGGNPGEDRLANYHAAVRAAIRLLSENVRTPNFIETASGTPGFPHTIVT